MAVPPGARLPRQDYRARRGAARLAPHPIDLLSAENALMDIRRIDPGPYLSSAVIAGNFVFLAGLVADDLAADVAGQTAQILRKIDHYLQEAGCDKSRIITAQIWLRDIVKWADVN